MKHGLLLINLGTPENPNAASVRRYLREFLSDRHVITLPAWLRYVLLFGFILPFRTKRTTHAYQQIWTPKGSPLLLNGQKLVEKLQCQLSENYQVALGMRYGKPSLLEAIRKLGGCQTLTILPLYPQYSSSATESAIEKTSQILQALKYNPKTTLIRDFYNHPSYIQALSTLIKKYLPEHDHLIFSYHGIPAHHLPKCDCLKNCSSQQHETCYRAQCFQTTALVAKELGLFEDFYDTTFQSRLGKTPWIKPYTDETLIRLSKSPKKRLAIVCPSFVADCLETLEEIGLRLRQLWLSLGGEELTLIPCLNDSQPWVEALLDIALISTSNQSQLEKNTPCAINNLIE